MTKEEFEAAARKYREEMFRLYARQPSPPAPGCPTGTPDPHRSAPGAGDRAGGCLPGAAFSH